MGVQVINPMQFFADLRGNPLDCGYVYIGAPNVNPLTNPISVYQDQLLTIPMQQPLRTTEGYIALNGTPLPVYVNGAQYSIVVMDSKGRTVFSQLNAYNPFYGVPVSAILFGADPSNTSDSTAAIQKWLNYLASTGGAGRLPGGKYKVGGQLVLDLAPISPTGVKIEGDGQYTSMLDLSTVSASPAFLITDTANAGGGGFYSSFHDFGIRTNIAGTSVQLGRTDFSDALNGFDFRNIWVGNNSQSANAIGIQSNYVLNSNFDNVIAANNGHGDAWQLNATAFCTWKGGSGTWADNGMHLTNGGAGNGTIAGNVFIGMDFEVNAVAGVTIDTSNAHNNTFMGGTFVYTIGSSHAVKASAGYENIIVGPSILSYNGTASFANFFNGYAGIVLQNVFGISFHLESGNPSFNSYMQSNQTLTPATWTKVTFNGIDFQNGTSYDPTTNQRFTCQIPGVYEFTLLLNVTATNSALATHYAAFYRNGSAVRTSITNVSAGTNNITLSLSMQAVLSVGDYVEAWANLAASSGSPTIAGSNTGSYFSANYLSS